MEKYKNSYSNILGKAALFACAVALFVLICFSVVSTVKPTALVSIALAFGGALIGFPRLRERISLPMLVLAAFVAVSGVSTFYAISGKFALQEFLKLLISFCVAMFFLATVKGTGAVPGRRIASFFEGASALAGLVSIDLLSTHLISDPVLSFLGRFSENYSTTMSGVEDGTRMISIFANPNVFAGCVGIGVLLSLGLVLSSESRKERAIHVVCLFVNALSFLLAFSMGATAFIALAFVLYLLTERRERLAGLFVLMAETMVTVLAATVATAMTAFEAWDGFQPVPMLAVVAGAAALCLLDRFVGQAIGNKFAAHGKAVLAAVAVVLVAVVGVGVAAYHLTGVAVLQPGESLRRSVYPTPGAYTLSAQVDGNVTVTVETQNQVDTMMHTSTVLYRGALADASFTVPEDSMVVYLTFYTSEGASLETAACVGTESVEVPLDYKLLPEFIANRLQGLWANQNAIQRTVFFEDGMKLFRRSPVVGLGMGCFETAIKSVQSFFYETKYAHNHYVQTLAETGVIGLIFFIAAIVTAAAAVVMELRRKDDMHPLTPALGAALLFIAGHSAMEVNFSFYAYLPFAFGVFALIGLCCGRSLSPKWFTVKVKTYALCAVGLLVAVFTVFLVQNVSAERLIDTAPSMKNLVKAAKMDKFEYTDYMLSYVVNSSEFADNYEAQTQADEFAAVLSEIDSNTVPRYLAMFYFQRGNVKSGLAMVEKYLDYMTSDAQAWDIGLKILRTYQVNTEEFRSGVSRIAAMLDEWNNNNLGTITLEEDNLAFLAWYSSQEVPAQ